MFRIGFVSLVVVSCGMCLFIAGRGDVATAPPAPIVNVQEPPGEPGGRPIKQSQQLPVKQVVLFNSGVGFFQRTGEVEGDARVDLQFSSDDINDLIKSLVIEDTKGKVMPLRYDSQEPIEKTLKSFGIDLSSNPSFAQVLNQARGEKVELTLQTANNGLPGTLTGTIMGMESAHRLATPTATTAVDMEFLNLLCAEGMRTVPLAQVQRLRFLNPTVESELRRALDVVAVGHDSRKKAVRLGFKGEGKREVKVGYVACNPIWKTSYRLNIDANGKPKLSAWANIENTSDEDWNDVKLTLVSSRPISFMMDLYPPLFIPRPTVEPALFASLRPPTYQGPLLGGQMLGGQFGFQGGAGFGGFAGGVQGNGTNPMQQQQALQLNGVGTMTIAGQNTYTGNTSINGGTLNFNRFQNNDAQSFVPQGKLSYQDLQNRRNTIDNNNKNPAEQQKAKQIGSMIANIDPELIEAALTSEELGNPTRFAIEDRVSLPRQQSAMLPIMERTIDGARVTIYNEHVQAKHPLLGMRVKNTSDQVWMQGPMTIYDNGQYVGDARTLDVQPGEERYISYAIDTAVEVKPYDVVNPGPDMTVRVENGNLNVEYKLRQTRTYVIKNRSPEMRKVVLEQPVRDGWKFAEARRVKQDKEAWIKGDAEKPIERTRDQYRFSVDVPAGETVKYEVAEELPRLDPFQNSKHTDWTGFATTLGLDVWTDTVRTPEDRFRLEVDGNHMTVHHLDRRQTTYFLRNTSATDRTIRLEHIVPKGRKMLGDAKPEAVPNVNRYRFPITLAAGKTVSHIVSEEREQAAPEGFPLKTAEGAIPPRAGTDDPPQERYLTELGFEVWATRKSAEPELTQARLFKGDLHTTTRNRETMRYSVRNLSEKARTFDLQHRVRTNWVAVGLNAPAENSGHRYTFVLETKPKAIVVQEVVEDQLQNRKQSFEMLTDSEANKVWESPAVSPALKKELTTGWQMRSNLKTLDIMHKEADATLKTINEEQARIRTNFEKLPEGSDLYKRLLDKLDKQETAVEKVQAELTKVTETERKDMAAYKAFLQKLDVK